MIETQSCRFFREKKRKLTWSLFPLALTQNISLEQLLCVVEGGTLELDLLPTQQSCQKSLRTPCEKVGSQARAQEEGAELV